MLLNRCKILWKIVDIGSPISHGLPRRGQSVYSVGGLALAFLNEFIFSTSGQVNCSRKVSCPCGAIFECLGSPFVCPGVVELQI